MTEYLILEKPIFPWLVNKGVITFGNIISNNIEIINIKKLMEKFKENLNFWKI